MADICDVLECLFKGVGYCCQTFLSAGSVLYPANDCCPSSQPDRLDKTVRQSNWGHSVPQSLHIDRLLLQGK